MNKIFFVSILVLAVIALVFWTTNKSSTNKEEIQIQNQNTTQYIKEAGLKITVPKGYIFSKELQMNYTKNKPFAVNFYIQNEV